MAPSAHRLQQGLALLGPWERSTALCLLLIYPREHGTTPQVHLLDATLPHRNTSIPHHIPQLPSLPTAHLGAAENSYLHSFSVSLDGSVHL